MCISSVIPGPYSTGPNSGNPTDRDLGKSGPCITTRPTYHTRPLLTDGLVLIVLTPGHQVFLCAARSSDPRSLSFSLYFLHFSSLRRNGSFPYHGLHKYRIPNQICTDAPKKETKQKHTKIISSRLAVRIRSALSLLGLRNHNKRIVEVWENTGNL